MKFHCDSSSKMERVMVVCVTVMLMTVALASGARDVGASVETSDSGKGELMLNLLAMAVSNY